MKLLKVGLLANAANDSVCSDIITVLSAQDILEICTPIVFDINDIIDNIANNTEQQEEQISICHISHLEDALDGKINVIDCSSESDSLNFAIAAYLDNKLDAIIDIPAEICNSNGSQDLSKAILSALNVEDDNTLDWTISGDNRLLMTSGEALTADIRKACQSLRRDLLLIKPRLAVAAKDDTSHDSIASLREESIMAFGPYESGNFIDDKKYLPFDAVIFCEEKAAHERLLTEASDGSAFEYISGIPVVFTCLDAKAGISQTLLKEAIYFSVQTQRNRAIYQMATKHPLEKQWVPRGRDDFKLDLSKEEPE